jgi:tetratricopeptide (TPR) repeat protein
MKRVVIFVLLMVLAVACFARTPTEEECQKEIETALKNIDNGKKPLASSDYTSAGTCFKNLKQYNKSLDCFINAAKLSIDTKDDAGVCADYQAVAGMYHQLQNEEKAKEFYTLAIDYCLKAGLTGRLIAEPYKKLGDYANSCKYCQMEKDYDYCKEYNYCKDSSSSPDRSSAVSAEGGFPFIPVILGVILIVCVAGFFLMRKKK